MKTSNDSAQPSRRRFLKGVLAVGGTTVLVAVGKEAMIDDEAPDRGPTAAAEQAPVSRGYRETDHVRAYYRAARL